MARGFIYEVAKDPALLNDVSAAYFCEDTDLIGCDFVSDEINADECIHDLLRWLERFGFKVDFRKKFFHIDPKSKQKFFEERFRNMQEFANKMTLQEFSADNTSLTRLKELIELDYNDCICESTIYEISCTYTMDHWIRAAETGTYFIGGVVLMH